MNKYKLKNTATLYANSTTPSKCGTVENTYIQVPRGKVVYGKPVSKVDSGIGTSFPRSFILLGGMEDDLIGKYIYASEVQKGATVNTENKYSNVEGEEEVTEPTTKPVSDTKIGRNINKYGIPLIFTLSGLTGGLLLAHKMGKHKVLFASIGVAVGLASYMTIKKLSKS